MEHQKYFNVYTIFAFVFLFKLLFIFQGINLNDEGFHLTQQVAAFTDRVDGKSITSAFFLSQYVGGAWLHLWDAPNLLWARLGGVLIYALNAAIIFHILSGYFDQKKTFLAVASTALFITMYEFNTIIHYYTFPALLLNVWLLALSQLIKNRRDDAKIRSYSFLLGFLIIPIILSRLSLILMLLLPGVILTYYWNTKTENMQLKKAAPYMICGLLAAAAAFALAYMQLGILDYYIENTWTTLTAAAMNTQDAGEIGEHNTHELIVNNVYDCICGIVGAVGVLLTMFLLFEVIAITGKKETAYAAGVIILILFIFIMEGTVTIKQEPSLVYLLARVMNTMSFIVLLLLSALFLYTDRRKNTDRTLLILAGAFIMFITPLGAAIGFIKSVHGMWLIMPLIILRAYEVRDNTRNIRLKSVLSMLDVLLFFLVITSILFQLVNVYTDDMNRLNLNTEFKHESLRNIYSTPDRVKVVDEVLFQIDNRTEKGDRVLMVDSIPLLYYLTETKPAIGDPWPVFRPLEKIEKDHKDMMNAGRYPKLFIYAKAESQEANWSGTSLAGGPTEILRYFKDEYVNNLNYTPLWENEAFAIYERGKE